ncbi:MAG: site-specific integrase [Promethearchaeia archaeon]
MPVDENDLLKNADFKEFWDLKARNLAKGTQTGKMIALRQFFNIVGLKNANQLHKKDIISYIGSEYFRDLGNSTKNLKITHIKTYLRYHKRTDLIDSFPKYREKDNELNKNELISREDLEKLLKAADSIELKTMIILFYESGCRRGELLSIRKKDIKFANGYANLYLPKSKTKERNIPLTESVPFLREFFNDSNFSAEDRLFPYTINHINVLVNRVETAAKEKFNDFEKDLNPHLFRHSRLTELATNRRLNESQLRRFAGWAKDSDQVKVYVHLDDSDLRNELLNQNNKTIKRKEIKGFEGYRCPQCAEINNKFNEFCWKCGKVLNTDLIVEKFNLQEKITEISSAIDILMKDVKKNTKEIEKLK